MSAVACEWVDSLTNLSSSEMNLLRFLSIQNFKYFKSTFSMKRLCEKTRLSLSTIKRVIRSLFLRKIILLKHRRAKNGTCLTNEITLNISTGGSTEDEQVFYLSTGGGGHHELRILSSISNNKTASSEKDDDPIPWVTVEEDFCAITFNKTGDSLTNRQQKYLNGALQRTIDSGVTVTNRKELISQLQYTLTKPGMCRNTYGFKHAVNRCMKLLRDRTWRTPIGWNGFNPNLHSDPYDSVQKEDLYKADTVRKPSGIPQCVKDILAKFI